TYGVAPITLAATGGASTSPVVFTVDGKSTAGAGSITGTALTVTGVGTIIVDANQAATTYGVAPITLAATGGASTSPVVFTVDGKSTAGAGSITGTALKISGVGTIIVDANQSATANYTAAAQQQLTITVNPIGTVVTPSASVASGGTLYTSGGSPITLSSTTAGAAIYYTLTSGATGTTPTAGSTLYTAAGIAIPAVGTWTLETIALEAGYTPSTVANVTFTVSSIPPNFSLAFSLPAITFTNGGSASETITVTPVGGFNSPITFTCSQNVSISCSFNPVTITPSGGPVSTVLTVSYSSLYSSLHRNSNPLLPTGATLAAALCFFGFRRRRNLKLVLMLAVSLMGLGLCTGCGGSFLGSSSTTPKSSLPVLASVVVTATSGTLVQTAQLQITVNSSNQ
ncbi:MAG: chitobiase/beta-hexosaminidase C-terminal domain-containing protein, partial [Terracidiphilus sp.]